MSSEVRAAILKDRRSSCHRYILSSCEVVVFIAVVAIVISVTKVILVFHRSVPSLKPATTYSYGEHSTYYHMFPELPTTPLSLGAPSFAGPPSDLSFSFFDLPLLNKIDQKYIYHRYVQITVLPLAL